MKILSARAEFVHVDGQTNTQTDRQTDRHTDGEVVRRTGMTNRIVAFRNFVDTPKNFMELENDNSWYVISPPMCV